MFQPLFQLYYLFALNFWSQNGTDLDDDDNEEYDDTDDDGIEYLDKSNGNIIY